MNNHWCYGPPRSPDITPSDFFLWGYVKDWVFIPPLSPDLADLKAQIIAAVKNTDASMLRACRKNLNIITMCAVLPIVHMSNISSCQKKLCQFSCCCEQFHYGKSFGFLVRNVCNHGEHHEMPYRYTYTYILVTWNISHLHWQHASCSTW